MVKHKSCWRCNGRGHVHWCDSAVRGAPMGGCFTEVCDQCGGTQCLPYDRAAPTPGYDAVLAAGGKRHADDSLREALQAIRMRAEPALGSTGNDIEELP